MGEIAEGVSFDTVAREWRLKWSTADGSDKAPLVAAQKVLAEHLSALKAMKGVKRVQRVVCGGCYDFKIITSLGAADFGTWEGAAFAPEAQILERLRAIDGVTSVETQTFTLMDM